MSLFLQGLKIKLTIFIETKNLFNPKNVKIRHELTKMKSLYIYKDQNIFNLSFKYKINFEISY